MVQKMKRAVQKRQLFNNNNNKEEEEEEAAAAGRHKKQKSKQHPIGSLSTNEISAQKLIELEEVSNDDEQGQQEGQCANPKIVTTKKNRWTSTNEGIHKSGKKCRGLITTANDLNQQQRTVAPVCVGTPNLKEEVVTTTADVTAVTAGELDLLSDENICRICLGGREEEDLKSPCRCVGSMKFVHKHCLNKWRKLAPLNASKDCCDVCYYTYQFGAVPACSRATSLFQGFARFLEYLESFLFPVMNLVYLYSLFPVSLMFIAGCVSNLLVVYENEDEAVDDQENNKHILLEGEELLSLMGFFLTSWVAWAHLLLELRRMPPLEVAAFFVIDRIGAALITAFMWNMSILFRLILRRYYFLAVVLAVRDSHFHKMLFELAKKSIYGKYSDLKEAIGVKVLERYSPDLLNYDDRGE